MAAADIFQRFFTALTMGRRFKAHLHCLLCCFVYERSVREARAIIYY
jgi:hypothetical protein